MYDFARILLLNASSHEILLDLECLGSKECNGSAIQSDDHSSPLCDVHVQEGYYESMITQRFRISRWC